MTHLIIRVENTWEYNAFAIDIRHILSCILSLKNKHPFTKSQFEKVEPFDEHQVKQIDNKIHIS